MWPRSHIAYSKLALLYVPDFLLLAFYLFSLDTFDTTTRTCTISECTLVSIMYCTSITLLLGSSHTACTMILNVRNQPGIVEESVHCYTFTVRHQRKICLYHTLDQSTCIATVFGHQSKIYITFSMQNLFSKISTMDERAHICPICVDIVLHHSYSVMCKRFYQNVQRNFIQFPHGELKLIKTNTLWYCRLCNKNIFVFNHNNSDSEFLGKLNKFMNQIIHERFSSCQFFLHMTLIFFARDLVSKTLFAK